MTILNVSTGSGQTYDVPGYGTAVAYTPTGRFTVYRKEDGIVEAPLGSLYKPLYFDEGWAVHGQRAFLAIPRATAACARATTTRTSSRGRLQGSTVIIYGTSRGEPKEGQPGF